MSVTTADRAARRGCAATTGPPGSVRLLCGGCRQNFATVEQRDKRCDAAKLFWVCSSGFWRSVYGLTAG